MASTLTGAGQKLCSALGVLFDKVNGKIAAYEVLQVRDQMLRRSADKHVDNRVAWQAVLKGDKVSEPLASVVLFYLST